MSLRETIAVVALFAAAGLVIHHAFAQEAIRRSDVLRHALDVPDREVIQVRVEFAAGATFGRHSHPGAEIAYVLEGVIEYRIDGKPSVTLHAGEALFIPAGEVHAARNAGSGSASELATYILEAGKPILSHAQ